MSGQTQSHPSARRSRSRRTRMGRPIALTSRDLEIFRWLSRYRYLRSTYLYAFVAGASETRFKERLGDLFHEGFLDRPEQQWHFADARCQPAVHELGEGARRVLTECEAGDARTCLRSSAHRQFRHALLTCDVLASLELGALSHPGVRFVAWAEILARAPEATRRSPTPFCLPVPGSGGTIVPDGLFGLEYSSNGAKTFRFFALEVDRATMPIARTDGGQTSYQAKLDVYRRIIADQVHKTHLRIPNLIVLTLTTAESHMDKIMRAPIAHADGAAAFLFQALRRSTVAFDLMRPNLGLFTEPWLRVGYQPLAINGP